MELKLTKDVILFYFANLILIFGYKWDGAMGKVGVLIVLGTYAYFFFKNVTYASLLTLVVLANPARMFSMAAFGWEFKFLYFMDMFFYMGFLILLSPQIKNPLAIDRKLARLLLYIIVFTLYQIIVSLSYKQNVASPFILLKYLEEYKLYVLAIFVCIPVYKVFLINPGLFIRTVIALSIIYTIVFIISANTDYAIVDLNSELRIRRSSLVRVMIQNAELFKVTMFMAAVALFVSDLKRDYDLYIAGILSLAVLVMSMYRMELTYTALTLLLSMMLAYRLLRSEVSRIVMISFMGVMGVMMVFMLMPSVWQGLTGSMLLAIKELSGDATQGVTQTRTMIELPHQMVIIKKYPYLGNGFDPQWWENFTNRRDWGLTDIPLTATLAKYGMVGMIIYYSRFLQLFPDAVRSIKQVGANKAILLENHRLEVYLLFAVVAYFFSMIFFRLFYVGWELTMGYLQSMFGTFIGIFYGIDHLTQEKIRNHNRKEMQRSGELGN